MISLFALPITLLVVLASSASGDQRLSKSLYCADHHPIRIGDELEPQLEKQLPGERPRENAET
jgi:hypothetical protein